MEKLKNPNSGLGQFCLNLGRHFHQQPHPQLEIDYYLPEFQRKVFGESTRFIRQTPIHKILAYRKEKYDLWHCIHQDSSYLPPNEETKLILTIHDLNFLYQYRGPKKAYKLAKLQKKVNRAHAITVISHFTEKTVLEHIDVGNKKIHVIPNGNPLIKVEEPKKPDFIHFHHFLFTIGIISKKKNFHVLIPLLRENPDLHLVIAGNTQGDYVDEIKHLAHQLKVENRLHFPGPVNNEQKNWLYRNCKAFVFPSLQEGFGLPVVEAMSLGAPVFLSDQTSLPEVGGKDAFYWKDFDPQSMNQIFQQGLTHFSSEQAARSIEWANQFSWEISARKYLELYEQL